MLSLPVGTEMFHFPTFPPLTLCVQVRVTGHDSCRVSPFGNPRITARLTAPRGLSQPPTSFIGSWCQGIHRAPLLTWPQKMLASTVQFSRYGRCRSRCPSRAGRSARSFDEDRSHSATTAPSARRAAGAGREVRGSGDDRPFPQDPTACRGRPSAFPSRSCCTSAAVLDDGAVGACQLVNVPPLSTIPGAFVRGMALDERPREVTRQVLLRKEVIQPHLPVRLPCYDFVPIADPTFDSSLSCGLGHWLRVLPTFVT